MALSRQSGTNSPLQTRFLLYRQTPQVHLLPVQTPLQPVLRRCARFYQECPMRFWSGQTILDVAVLSQCEDFVAECCREAMDRRFA
eukprot:2308280-Rhodomonas_salina.1